MKRSRCLVLGANGFIGSHIVDHLVDKGYEVVAFDRFSLPPKYNKSPLIKQVMGDMYEEDDISAALRGVDYVFHCFSATTPASSDNDPYRDIAGNLLNNVKIFDACVENKIKKIVYLSSGGTIYGENGSREEDQTLPISPYGISKLATERYLAYFEKKYGMQSIIYRLSNPYGPRQITKNNQGVIPRFLDSIANGKTITVYGDGTSTRDYIFIEDAADIICSTFDKPNKHSVYNLGSGYQTSLTEIIETIQDICHKQAIVEYVPAPATFIDHASLSTARVEDEFGVKATTTLEVGLRKTFAGEPEPIVVN